MASSTLRRIKELGFDWQEIGSLGGKSWIIKILAIVPIDSVHTITSYWIIKNGANGGIKNTLKIG